MMSTLHHPILPMNAEQTAYESSIDDYTVGNKYRRLKDLPMHELLALADSLIDSGLIEKESRAFGIRRFEEDRGYITGKQRHCLCYDLAEITAFSLA